MPSSFAATVALAAAAIPCVLGALGGSKPLDPSLDPFFQPPAGYQSSPPGTILNSRTINTPVVSTGGQAYQLLFRTTAVNGSAIAGATTIFKPANALLDRFVSFHTAYDSSAVHCNPSYQYQTNANQSDAITSFEEMFIKDYLQKGYIVASPDYEGPDAAFGPGRLAGKVVLDGMRAVSSFQKTLGFTTSTPSIVGAGYSGGAIATGWAASLHPTYARELPVKGWAFGGTPANLTGTLVFLDNTLFSGFVPDAVAGLLKPSAYLTQLKPLVDGIATTSGLAYLDYATSHCAIDDVTHFPGQSILSTKFQSLGPALLQNPMVASVMLDNLMGHKKSETPIAPVYMYHASGDEIIPYANASTLATTWCNNGASVQFLTITSGGHATTEINGFSGASSFVDSAFAGNTAKGCARTSKFAAKGVQTLQGVSSDVAAGLRNALAILGPDDENVKKNVSVLRIPASM